MTLLIGIKASAGVKFFSKDALKLAGKTVSIKAGKYVFKDSAGNVLLEAGEQEVDAIKGASGGEALEDWSKYMSPEDAARYNQWVKLREAGLDQAKKNDIILTNKGLRPNSNTYLSETYINNHLKQFDNGHFEDGGGLIRIDVDGVI